MLSHTPLSPHLARPASPLDIYIAENTPLSHERPPRKRKSGFDSELRDTGKRAKNEGVRTTPKSLLKKTSSKKVGEGLEDRLALVAFGAARFSPVAPLFIAFFGRRR